MKVLCLRSEQRNKCRFFLSTALGSEENRIMAVLLPLAQCPKRTFPSCSNFFVFSGEPVPFEAAKGDGIITCS